MPSPSLFIVFFIGERNASSQTAASKPMPLLTANMRLAPSGYVMVPRSMEWGVPERSISSNASRGFAGMPRSRARSLLDPEGIYPRRIREVFLIPCRASFTVPSPPRIIRLSGEEFLEVIFSAILDASPAFFEK